MMFALVALLMCAQACAEDVHLNLAVPFGERVELTMPFNGTNFSCKNVIWFYKPLDRSKSRRLVINGVFDRNCVPHLKLHRNCSLVLTMAAGNVGRYHGLFDNRPYNWQDIVLVGISGAPQCHQTTSGAERKITCAVRYAGRWAPTIKCLQEQTVVQCKNRMSRDTIRSRLTILLNDTRSYTFTAYYGDDHIRDVVLGHPAAPPTYSASYQLRPSP